MFESLFNLDPVFDVGNLVFSDPPTKVGVFTDPTINTGVNVFQADGDGFFDIQILFDNTDGADYRFGVGESVAYTIISTDAITASSFVFLSEADGGGQGMYPVAAKIGDIGPSDESGWISVPEPAALSLIALGGLVLMRRRR